MDRQPIILRTYSELEKWVKDFKTNPKAHCVCIFGNAGLGKTETIKAELGEWEGTNFVEGAKLIKGKLTPFILWGYIIEAKDRLIQFDDTREILKNAENVNLLMQLTEHKKTKRVQYNSKSAGDTKEILTTSRCIICINRIDDDNKDLEPMFSRAICLEFKPTKQETHDYVGTWFLGSTSGGSGMARRQDVYDTAGKMLTECPRLDVRDYNKALSAYNLKKPAEFFRETWTKDRYAHAALQIKNHIPKLSKKDAVAAFEKMCGGSPAQLYREKAALQDDEEGKATGNIDLATALAQLANKGDRRQPEERDQWRKLERSADTLARTVAGLKKPNQPERFLAPLDRIIKIVADAKKIVKG